MLLSSTDTQRLTENQLSLWLNFIEHQIGFVLPTSQVNWVKGVIERHLHNNQLTSTQFLNAVAHDQALFHELVDDILIPRTQFFRHIPSFDFISCYAKAWQRQHDKNLPISAIAGSSDNPVLTAWSVGCSTGQEAVSMALTLKQSLTNGQDFVVYGSDFHQKSLQYAKRGRYDNSELPFIPHRFHPLLANQSEGFGVKSDIAQQMQFFSQNLIEIPYSLPIAKQQCQIIVCKNVLIYFRQFEQRDIIRQLMAYLADDGIMIFGAGEVMQLGNLSLQRLAVPTVNAYAKQTTPDWVQNLKI